MNEHTWIRCAQLLAATWPREPLPADTLRVYQLLLQHLPDDVVELAVLRCCATCTWLPRPAEILREAHAVLAERGDAPPEPEIAWHSALIALRRGSTLPCHPTTRAAIAALGGLRALSSVSYEQLPALERRFRAVYTTLCRRRLLEQAGLAPAALSLGLEDDAEQKPEPQYLPDPA